MGQGVTGLLAHDRFGVVGDADTRLDEHFQIVGAVTERDHLIRAQAEAGVVMGLSVAFHEKVRFEGGGVKTANYSDYPVQTMSEVPEIEVHIAGNTLKPGGVGEPVFPSVAPAVANAAFKATGVRLRELPLKRELLIRG